MKKENQGWPVFTTSVSDDLKTQLKGIAELAHAQGQAAKKIHDVILENSKLINKNLAPLVKDLTAVSNQLKEALAPFMSGKIDISVQLQRFSEGPEFPSAKKRRENQRN